ncbi:hypothetical protein HZZ13_27770 [Bradyrhizobium sp. CNPSo 4010]|uniref:Uncharacterized protein n=1 Tax=Bradyrhizobium agreste TaxID=2751811 RepID=A0ABS0PWG3_9BRAD|nr:hypothetical protein [Bradyrhizobium agreste]MBH5401556.1 hypothetical protein [Bradyrhizobium agreste]
MVMFNFRKLTTTGFDEDALTTSTADELVFNFGSLTTSGDLANGISANADRVMIDNFGRITTSGLGAAGIVVLGDDAQIRNFGSVITQGGSFDPDPNVDGDEVTSDAIIVFGDRFVMINDGTLRVHGDFASGMSGIGADGTMINHGRIDSSAFASVVMAGFGDRIHAINAGDVVFSGDEAVAMLLFGEGARTLNTGRVIMNGDGNAGIGAAASGAEVTNRGLIEINGDESTAMAGFGRGHHLENFGRLVVHGDLAFGMASAGRDLELVNAGTIVTEGDVAIGVALGVNRFGFRSMQDGDFENKGVIHTHGDGSAGVILGGTGSHFVNSGNIATDGGAAASPTLGNIHAAGVLVSGVDVLVENRSDGAIRSSDPASAAVELNAMIRPGLSNAETSSRLDNAGLIKAAGTAILGGDGRETVVNHGSIVGDVVLGDGADTFVLGSHGHLAGKLYLGGGNDLVRIERDAGSMRVADFAAGTTSGDAVDLSAYFSSFDQVMAHSRQAGSDVVVELGHDRLVLEHVQLAALNGGDFVLT